MQPRKYLFPHVIEMNYQAGRPLGVNVYLIDGGSEFILIDIGYRYLNIGDVKTGNDAFGVMTFKNVAAHEARVGLRWSFDELRFAR